MYSSATKRSILSLSPRVTSAGKSRMTPLGGKAARTTAAACRTAHSRSSLGAFYVPAPRGVLALKCVRGVRCTHADSTMSAGTDLHICQGVRRGEARRGPGDAKRHQVVWLASGKLRLIEVAHIFWDAFHFPACGCLHLLDRFPHLQLGESSAPAWRSRHDLS